MKKWLVIASLCACNGEEKEGEEGPEDHACEHRGEVGATLVSTADPASAPSLAIGEPATVTLVSGETGRVLVEVAEDTPALLFAGTADVVTALVHDGTDVDLPTGAPNEVCPDDIPEHFDLDLAPGSWQIGVGPAGVDEVWLMLSSAEGHAH